MAVDLRHNRQAVGAFVEPCSIVRKIERERGCLAGRNTLPNERKQGGGRCQVSTLSKMEKVSIFLSIIIYDNTKAKKVSKGIKMKKSNHYDGQQKQVYQNSV